MTKKFHICTMTILILGVALEVLEMGIASAIAGGVVILLSLAYSYVLAKNNHKLSFVAVVLVQIFAIYLFAKPYAHYSTSQYVDGKFVGNPHIHRIWDSGHVH